MAHDELRKFSIENEKLFYVVASKLFILCSTLLVVNSFIHIHIRTESGANVTVGFKRF